MKLQLIRNATMKIEYAGSAFLTDPVLGQKHSIESFGGVSKNPTVDLPISPEEVIMGIDAVITSHLHQDHFDLTAKKIIPKDVSFFCQPEDRQRLIDLGFVNTQPVDSNVSWKNIKMIRTPGSHGHGKWAEDLAPVSGFVFKAQDEPTLYWIGDSILMPDVEAVIQMHQPDVILTHSSGAVLEDSGPIVMDAVQTVAVCELAPNAKIVAVHMDALDHGKVTRDDLMQHAKEKLGSLDNLFIPNNGEQLSF